MRRRVYPDVVDGQSLVCLPPEATARAAAEVMAGRDIGAVLVGRADHLLGIVTEGDITERVVSKGRDPNATSLKDIMTPQPICAQADDTPMEALWRMDDGCFCHLPVRKDGVIVGMLVRADFDAEEVACAEFERSLWEHIR